jgi:hypothetical protein
MADTSPALTPERHPDWLWVPLASITLLALVLVALSRP